MNGEGRIKVKTWPYLEMINCAPIFLITALNNTFCQAFSVKPRLRTIDPGVMQTTEYSLYRVFIALFTLSSAHRKQDYLG